MTDERFDQLMKQALKPEIDERDVVIPKNTNNYKNRMKRKRRLRVCITAGIAAAACVVAGVQLNRFGKWTSTVYRNKAGFCYKQNIICIFTLRLCIGAQFGKFGGVKLRERIFVGIRDEIRL